MIIGIFLRHIKAYKGINFIPISEFHNFVSYVGENGSGKSSILEALDSFFNYKNYPINKSAISDGIGLEANEPFISPVFLIRKDRVTKNKKQFEKISELFWNIRKEELAPGIKGSMKNFFELREGLIKKDENVKDDCYLIVAGEKNLDSTKKVYFSSFTAEKQLIDLLLEGERGRKSKKDINEELNKNYKDFLIELKELYSYVYIPVEVDLESFTKIETKEMQKIFDKEIHNEIMGTLKDVNTDTINNKLNDFIHQIEDTLDKQYFYDTGGVRKKTLTKLDLIEKILEAFFQKRVLTKGDSSKKVLSKKISELSAGEKRQALIELIYAFLKKAKEREKMVIIGIDEPENSLHTSLCYNQFEKLKEISENNQILITTHWYGFLPIVSEGVAHFLKKDINGVVEFETYDLYDYRAKVKQDVATSRNTIPKDFSLKSTNDLVQAIFYSLKGAEPYNWLICEGISEKIYFEYFFKEEIVKNKLRILPVGGQSKVSEIYEYLELPIKGKSEDDINGKVYCLIDTDRERYKENITEGYNNLKIRRLYNNDKTPTELITLANLKTGETTIENALNPIIFEKTMQELEINERFPIEIKDKSGNTDFIYNLQSLKLKDYFSENDGDNKIAFAREYIRFMNEEEDAVKYIPKWIGEIKTYFN